jgi:hypothetical protein
MDAIQYERGYLLNPEHDVLDEGDRELVARGVALWQALADDLPIRGEITYRELNCLLRTLCGCIDWLTSRTSGGLTFEGEPDDRVVGRGDRHLVEWLIEEAFGPVLVGEASLRDDLTYREVNAAIGDTGNSAWALLEGYFDDVEDE